MSGDREVETVEKRGRNVSIVLFLVGIVLVLLGIVLLPTIMIGTVYLVFLGALMAVVGIALSDRYGRLERWYGSEAAGTFFKTFVVGVGLSFLGLFILVLPIFGVRAPIEQSGVYFIFICGLIFGGFIVVAIGRFRLGTRQRGGVFFDDGIRRAFLTGSQSFMRSLKQINPEKSFKTKNFSVMKKSISV